MDQFGYKSYFSELEGVTPKRKLVVAGQHWDIGLGEHPSLITTNVDVLSSASRRVFTDLKYDGPYSFLTLPPVGNIYGHNTASDAGYQALISNTDPACVSPLFVRDLAGRTIYIGLGPEVRPEGEWTDGNQQVLFPKNCLMVDASVQGTELIENVFFTSFRCLDASTGHYGVPADAPQNRIAGFYEQPNLYPYKLRLDTFYIDGWRLPQTQMLYVKTEDTLSRTAEEAGASLLRAWAERPTDQSYEDFYEQQGEAYFDKLFQSGCTLIPTIEACNGYNQVGPNFELLDYWSGRAVKGLHEVVERRTDEAPEGTILEVVCPGYALGHRIEPAKVIVSDGAEYVSDNQDNADPQVIDVRLPHPRSSSKWGACWLPTLPKHFEAPAIWGWDDETGHFMQLRGPVWDPLHYYYASVPEVLKAFESDTLVENRWLVKVPEAMRLRFYPAVAMRGFDVLDADELASRQKMSIQPATMIRRFDDGKASCTVGYHPLPLPLELEIDNWWFPELHPANRQIGELSFKLEDRIVPVIDPKTTPQEYLAVVNPPADAPWVNAMEHLQMPVQGRPMENYPQLHRYKGQLTLSEIKALSFVHLEYQFTDGISATSQVEYDPRDFEKVEAALPGLYQQLKFLDVSAQERMALRQKLYIEHYDTYIMSWWTGGNPQDMAKHTVAEADKRAALPSAATAGVSTV